jgi:hypothetical protein
MQSDIDSARLWRGGAYSLVVALIGVVAAMTVLSATGLSRVFWVEGAAVLALLGLNLWQSTKRQRSRRSILEPGAAT